MLYDAAFFLALLSTALAMGAALAHALELPHKIGLDREAYFTVQQIYAGWNRLAFLLIVEVLAIAAVIGLGWHEPYVRGFAAAALAGLIAAQAVFWLYTQPANVATQNWTVMPEAWAALRRQWEYSHLAGAGFQTLAMAMLILAARSRKAA